jgi:restriction system protein
MNSDQISIKRHEEVNSRYTIKYIAEVTHAGLNDYKVFTSTDEDILENKINSHIVKLEEKWGKLVEKQNIVKQQIASQNAADEKTQAARKALEDIDNILIHTLSIDDSIDWEKLKDKTKFNEPNPENELNRRLGEIAEPILPIIESHLPKPIELDFEPKLSFWDKLIKSNKEKKIQQAKETFELSINKWNNDCLQIDRQNAYYWTFLKRCRKS